MNWPWATTPRDRRLDPAIQAPALGGQIDQGSFDEGGHMVLL